MKTPEYQAELIASFFKAHDIATLEQICEVMGGASKRTAFRYLKQLGYLTSYSHRGKYYSLRSIAKFSREGLWSVDSVWFSRSGTLLETVVDWVERSEAGYDAAELTNDLHVESKHALTRMYRQNRIMRENFSCRYVYFALDSCVASSQRMKRAEKTDAAETTSFVTSNYDLEVVEAKAALMLFFSMLNEKQRRLYAGLESLKLGYGGDTHIAGLFGIDPHTVARGRRELESGNVDMARVRSEGGGRHSQKKKLQR